MNTNEILTVNDLINELQKFNGNQKVRVAVEDKYCHKINDIFEDSLFDYKGDIFGEKIVFIVSNKRG